MAKKEKQLPKIWRDVSQFIEDNNGKLVPDEMNPFCLKCRLCEHGSKRFLKPHGSEDPWLTVVFDGVSPKEDDAGEVAVEGSSNGNVRRNLEELAKTLDFPVDRIRWLPLTRCANRIKVAVNYKTKGNWCRTFAVDDLMRHPPRMILAVGSIALGHLSHKSNASDWSGKILTWRGWPDDWLTSAQYDNGHPALPRPPVTTIPLYAVQTPRIIFAQQSIRETARWKGQLKQVLELAKEGTPVPNYDRPYFNLIEDPEAVIAALEAIPEGALVTYDSETKGLLQFAADAAIVAMMFRYDGPDGPVAFGFPWNYPESPMVEHINRITPFVLAAMYRARLQGHNLTFDILYAYAVLAGADLRKLTNSMAVDTRHLIYTLHQTKESLGLELIAYRWCPEMAGYEEEFTLIKDHTALAPYLDPGAGQGGHYSRALLLDETTRNAYKTYIMGDVEVCHVGADNIRAKLAAAKVYPFPLCDPNRLGFFRKFTPPPRMFVYDKIMLPANRMLTRMMGQGMFVDLKEVEHQENIFPKMIKEARASLRKMDDRVVQWCEEQEATTRQKDGSPWQLDLENREQLKHILFNIMQLPVKRITKSGEKQFKTMDDVPPERLLEFAAVDKFTINALAAEHKGLQPLQEYRKLHKAYTAFVRSMRNITTEGIDKKARKNPPYLQADGMVHASFNQCGTRSGRLGCCISGETEVVTSAGLVQINKLKLENGPIYALTHRGRWRRIKGLYYKGVQPMYRVRTKTGAEIVCTQGHAFLTLSGWKRLSSLAVGNTLVTCEDTVQRTSHVHAKLEHDGNGIGREALHRSIFSTEVDGRSTGGNGHQQEAVAAYQKILASTEQELRPAGRSSAQAPLGAETVARRESTPAHRIGESGEASGTFGHGMVFSADCLSARNDRVHGEQEHTALRDQHPEENANVFHHAGSTVRDRRDREDLPRYSRRAGQRDSGQSHVYQEVVRRVLEAPWASSIFEEREPGVEGTRGTFRSFPAVNQLVDQLSRDSHIRGTERGGDTTHPRICIFWNEEGRLCDYWHEYLGGTGRRVSYGAAQQTMDAGGHQAGIPGYSFSGEESDLRTDASCGSHQGRDSIVSIAFEDYLGVWDIEVDEDASYVAQGFVNHNSRPNLAQLPKTTIVKRMYSSRFGKDGCIYQGDLSQIELRLLAAACGDPLMVDAYRRSIDLHSLTASNIFKIPYEHLNKDYFSWLQKNNREKEAKDLDRKRSIAKTTNFLTGYGGGAFGLQTTLAEEQVYLTVEECESIVDALFDTYPSLRRYIGVYKNFILEHGCAVSIFGRVRPLPEVYSEDNGIVNKALRAGFNHLIQSTASDIMLLAMAVIDQAMYDQGLESRLVSTVHDSLVADTRIDELPFVHDIVDSVINNIPEVLASVLGPDYNTEWCNVVPLAGDCEVGKNYYDALKMDSFKTNGEVDWDKVRTTLTKV